MTIMLGIDTGGTYTDAVLFEYSKGVLAKAKSLTTRLDLSVGIKDSVAHLPIEARQQIELVSLSTTLATNAVVEGYGSPVCVILAGYSEADLARSRIPELLEDNPVVLVSGGHNAAGEEACPLDLEAVRSAVTRYKDQVTAFALSSCFSVRNPSHEIQMLSVLREVADRPATCGHQLASGLDAPRRALTTALNARLINYIQRLLDAVKGSLSELGIDAPIMVVRSDGSLMNAEMARQKPIETILSGPAASLIGACYLSGHKNAIVADMGGTTTDVAIVRDGQVETSEEGAVIGDWRPMTNAVKVYSVGLGGDSEVYFRPAVGMDIGPRRVVPISLLTQLYPQIIEALNAQIAQSPSPRHNRFALRFQHNEWLLSQLDQHEREIWQMLEEKPVDLEQLAMDNRQLSRAVARLHRRGLLIYSGFTPSDAGHVLYKVNHWCREGAVIAAQLWARQMRHLYGFGQWHKDDYKGPCQSVLETVSAKLSRVLIMSGINQLGIHETNQVKSWSDMLSKLLLENRAGSNNDVFHLGFSKSLPLIGAGAPSKGFFPDAANQLGLELLIPDNAEVTNAVGAVAGKIMQNVQILISQPSQGTFRVHTPDGPENYNDLQQAYQQAEKLASALAVIEAVNAGAADPTVTLNRLENAVNNDIDGYVFFESTVVASATGQPRL